MKPHDHEVDDRVLKTVLDELARSTALSATAVDRIMREVVRLPAPTRGSARPGPSTYRVLAVAAALATLMGTAAALSRDRSPRDVQRVRFEIRAPDASAVSVVGDFNDWLDGSTPMGPAGEGVWATEVELPAGRYEYAYRVDGRWQTDVSAPSGAADDFGGPNSVLIVPEASQ